MNVLISQKIILLLLLAFPLSSISWLDPSSQRAVKLYTRGPSDDGGGEPNPSDSGSQKNKYSEPLPWVILLKLPTEQSTGVDPYGVPWSSEAKAKYFQEMVHAVKKIKAKDTSPDPKYWARGLSGSGEDDIWYFCLITSVQQVESLYKEYQDLIASVRPLASLYPARMRKAAPVGFIRNRKRVPAPNKKSNIKARNITTAVNSHSTHGMEKRMVMEQLRAPRDLRAIGAPPWIWDQRDDWEKVQYNYDEREGRATEAQVVVYVICKGVDIKHPARHPSLASRRFFTQYCFEFSDIHQREMKDWIWGAGTAVFGKIFGKTVGTARQAKPVVVMAADGTGRTSRLHILDSLLQIHADIIKRFKGRKIVISMSWILTALPDPDSPKYKIDTFDRNLIKSIGHIQGLLSQLGVAFVVPGGSSHWDDEVKANNAITNPIVGFPAKLGLKKWKLGGPNPFITVGGVDMVSWDTYYQSHGSLRVSAPAVDILVPLPSSPFNSREIGPPRAFSPTPGDYGTVKGTAYAAGTVAGLLAYFLAMGFNRNEAKTIMYAYSYGRADRGFQHSLEPVPDVVYNGILGLCRGGTSHYGPLTRELVETERDELLREAELMVETKWPSELDSGSDGGHGDDPADNPKQPTDPNVGDPLPGWSEGPDEEAPPVYDPEGSWKRGSDSNKSYWPKCPIETSSSSSFSSTSSSLSSSFTTFTTSTMAKTTETTSGPTHTSHSVTETEYSTESFSSIRATSTPADSEDEEEDNTPTKVTEPEEPAPTLDWADESLVGEMTWADSALLWVIPAVSAPFIILHIPLAGGGTLTSTITNTNYTSYTVYLDNPSRFDLSKLGISTVPASTTENKFPPVVPITTTASQTSTAATGSVKPTVAQTTPPPPPLNTMHSCKQLFFTTPKPTASASSAKRWIQTLPVTSWYYVERNLVASVINSNEVCGEDAPELKGKEGGLDKTFYEGSPENFQIKISWTSNPPTKQECRENLHHILDGCHGNNPLNPWNWKGGGTRIIGGTKYYEIRPLDPYRRPPGPKWAACRFWLSNGQAYAKVWGYGFLDAFDDVNHNLARPRRIGRGPLQFYNKAAACLGWDGNWWMAPTTPIPHESALWEWVLSIGFKTRYFSNRQGKESKRCLEGALREASGIPTLECGNKEWDKGVKYFWDSVTMPGKNSGN
ncbi:hypothetical protein TWF718_010580 [Orbilia javanica]|uniref:Peptidase S8/S53 domain-containing protein n=1 Tax=Orbilia javanica TaxID=47235 RepID=A0AAN8REC2_9PEZI